MPGRLSATCLLCLTILVTSGCDPEAERLEKSQNDWSKAAANTHQADWLKQRDADIRDALLASTTADLKAPKLVRVEFYPSESKLIVWWIEGKPARHNFRATFKDATVIDLKMSDLDHGANLETYRLYEELVHIAQWSYSDLTTDGSPPELDRVEIVGSPTSIDRIVPLPEAPAGQAEVLEP